MRESSPLSFSMLCVTIWMIATLTFILMKTLPGDPFNEEQALPKDVHEQLRIVQGFNHPWFIQYKNYLIKIASGDFGESLRFQGRSVSEIIRQSFPTSALLGTLALGIAISSGIFLGILSALWQQPAFHILILCVISLLISIPAFLLASSLQYIFGVSLGWVPIARWGSFQHLILPALSLAAAPAAFIASMTRSNLIHVMKQDYIKTAQAKGVSRTRILFVHGLRNALLPLIAYLGPLIVNVLVGSFVIEKIFSIPGLGQWFVNSILNRDYPVIMGTTLFYTILLLVMTYCVDKLYGWIDPRIRKSSA